MNFTVSIILLAIAIGLGVIAWIISYKRPDISIWLTIQAAVICVLVFFMLTHLDNPKHKHPIVIIESVTDERNLTSIIYINVKGDTVGLDYLTYNELCNLR